MSVFEVNVVSAASMLSFACCLICYRTELRITPRGPQRRGSRDSEVPMIPYASSLLELFSSHGIDNCCTLQVSIMIIKNNLEYLESQTYTYRLSFSIPLLLGYHHS